MPLSIDVAAGDVLFANSNVIPLSGGSYPVAKFASIGNTDWEYRVPNTTVDYTSALPAGGINTNGNFYAPHAICGMPKGLTGKRPPQVFVWGDSIAEGSGDSGAPPWGTYDQGWIRRGLNNQIPYVWAARSGTGVLNFNANAKRRGTATLMAGCTHAIEAFGANDLGVTTLATYQATRLDLWNLMASRGIKVFATTVTPRTDSTDSWATTTNQTTKAWESSRVTFNDWLRGGAPLVAGAPVAVGTTDAVIAGQAGHPLFGCIDTADAVESARNSGFWRVNGSANYATADGLHPSPAAHLLMAATVPLAAFVPA
jgi:lysophospholipase L1-like esterase